MNRGLSPVPEVSPELGSAGSTESLNKSQTLEMELNVALSRLNSLTNELTEVEVSVLETRQTKVTETVTTAAFPEARGDSSSSFEGKKDYYRIYTNDSIRNFHTDACEEFPNIPVTSPTLGIQAGRDKRNLATARNSKPPSGIRKVLWSLRLLAPS